MLKKMILVALVVGGAVFAKQRIERGKHEAALWAEATDAID
ncbi:MAG: DLW-39 family protein [Nocardioides sp.]